MATKPNVQIFRVKLTIPNGKPAVMTIIGTEKDLFNTVMDLKQAGFTTKVIEEEE